MLCYEYMCVWVSYLNIRFSASPNTCIRNVKVMGISLYDRIPKHEESCCSIPDEPILYESVISLDGFGYAVVSQFPRVRSQFSFNLVIRSYSPDGVILSLLTSTQIKVDISYARGKIALQHNNASLSDNYYNYGEWFALSCVASNTTLTCNIDGGDKSEKLTTPISDSLDVLQVIFGSRLANTERFAGCLANITINNQPIDVWAGLLEAEGVLPYCYEKV